MALLSEILTGNPVLQLLWDRIPNHSKAPATNPTGTADEENCSRTLIRFTVSAAVHSYMRLLAAALALLAFALPVRASTRITVAQLEQTLVGSRTVPDVEIAKRLSDLELTERLSTVSFDRLESALTGEQSRQALMILADESVFLDPPAAEIPKQPPPDAATQRKILGLTVDYVTQALHQLPNFYATRLTRSFEDTPAVTIPGAATSPYQPIHPVGNSDVIVKFRGGHEVVEKSNFDPRIRNLTTSGVFGPILGTVLVDAASSRLEWSHWEQGPAGLRAVFSYEVPKGNSHYTITYDSPQGCTTIPQTINEVVAYHGEIVIDPSSGTILRVTLLADMNPGEFTDKSGIEVEYGQVSIAGKDYILPIRSVTSSLAHSLRVAGGWGHGQGCQSLAVMPDLQTSLNDVVFENYHVFRGDTRMLTNAEAAAIAAQPPEPAPASPSSTDAASHPASSSQSNPTNPTVVPGSADFANSANLVISAAPASPANIPVFKTTARQVLVDVVVDKKDGDPVSGLPQSDFSIEEDGKPQAIDFFEEHLASASAAAAPPAMPPMPAGAVTNVPAAPPTGSLYVLLLDSLNTQPRDQVYVREQVLKYLHKMDPGTEVAVFHLGDNLQLLQGFTSDPAALLAAVSRKEAERNAMAQTSSDNADDAEDAARLSAMQSQAPAGGQFAQVQAYSYGARASMTFEALNALARYLEGIPGRKNLVWFASSFPVIFFPTSDQIRNIKMDPNLPGYLNSVRQTADLFTLSKIAVYPVSGAGVMTSTNGLAQSADMGGGTGHFGSGAMNPVTGEIANSSSAAMSSLSLESLNFATAITGMEQLASSTGGRAFTTNDIDNALHKIVHLSDVYYAVGYAPPDNAEDGSFRRIDVKVSGGKYKLDYRQGYNAVSTHADGATQEGPIAGLLQLGLPNSTGVLYGASVTPSADHGSESSGQNPQLKGPLTRYTVSFTIRAQDVSFGKAPSGQRIAKLLVAVKAYGKDGAALNWQATREAAEVSPDEYESILKTGLPVMLDIDLPAKTPAQLVTAVYDWNTGRSGTLEIPLDHP